jgi:hypothetical protein
MIREVIQPTQATLSINIPSSYINKKLEFILFPLDESEITPISKETNKPQTNITSSLFGVLKDKNINLKDYDKHLEEKYL